MNENFFRTADEETLGKFAEQLWQAIFRASRVRYIPLCNIDIGRAPVLDGDTATVLPDFKCLSPEHKWTACIDSKCKKSAVLWRKMNQLRHGINLRSWRQYQEYAEITSEPCGLAVMECFVDERHSKWSGSLLVQSLRALGEPVYGFNEPTQKVYWPRGKFRRLGDHYSPEQLYRIAKGCGAPSFELELVEIFDARKQVTLF